MSEKAPKKWDHFAFPVWTPEAIRKAEAINSAQPATVVVGVPTQSAATPAAK